MQQDNTVRQDEVQGMTPAVPAEAPEHQSNVERQVSGELVIPGTSEARSEALGMLKTILGQETPHYATATGLRQAFALVWNRMAVVEGSFAQRRMAALIEMFQQNEHSVITAALSRENVTKGTSDYQRLSELNSVYKAYLLVGTEALESATFDAKGLPHSWDATKKSITVHLQAGRKVVAERKAFIGAELKVRAAMRVPGTAELYEEAKAKARQLAQMEIDQAAEAERKANEAKKTPQGIAQRHAKSIVRDCKTTDAQNVERIDEATANTIAALIVQAVKDEIQSFNTAAAEAEKEASEQTKH